ncbi:hypothetical protein [Endozoicomonas sp. GU-1]|uniref:hypothetical protein n=1 Tax=Endozoicomonas sp. GU-1 TaxID=3009078 RepID=UPI0022B43E74|nr:hypothetical protein [Endozoicomonas sp. GU-1]WBA79911.1 hypothetical protein O2T12_16270 [Endozoicomonas sp. GU-1]
MDAVTHGLRAMDFLSRTRLELNKEGTFQYLVNVASQLTTFGPEHVPSPDKGEIACNAANIRDAKRYAPMRKFIVDQYHKSSYQSVAEAAKVLAEPLRDFCKKKEDIGYLSPSRDKRTIAGWLNSHIKNCPTCLAQ